MNFQEIGGQICKTRKAKKITQKNLGSQLGMSRATISGIENGTINEIGIRKIIAICEVLELELKVEIKSRRPNLEQLLEEQKHG
ncbi:MAG: HTH-type transcriptional regulator / antitoxin HipB [Pseudomonadota bacterium]|nr:HTH-type transcriptional regulator / antitoxin HipB [Pseudomonadota bacterium]